MKLKAARLNYSFEDFGLIKMLQKDYNIILNTSLLNENKMFKKYNIKIQSFVCGDDLKRYPL